MCESDAANRMVRVQAARSLATIYKALKGDRQVKLRTGITKVVEGTTDTLLVRELLPCLDGLAVTPGSKVGVATTETKAAATAKVTPTATATATVAVTAAPPAKPTPSPAAPSPVPPPTAKAVSPLVKPAPAPADKPKAEPKVATASEPQTQVQSPQAVPAGNRLVTPPPAVTTAEELPAYLKVSQDPTHLITLYICTCSSNLVCHRACSACCPCTDHPPLVCADAAAGGGGPSDAVPGRVAEPAPERHVL